MSEIPKNEDPLLPKKTKTTVKMDKPKKIGTPKRKQTEEELINTRISIKERLLKKAHDFDDEEINLADEIAFEKFINDREHYDKLRNAVFDMEYRTRASVIYEDSEFVEDILEVVNTVPNPIVIYTTDMEPLNQKLTEYINKPGGYLADYIMPEFDDIRRMLKEIREEGDCQVYEKFVPKEGTEQFDDYVTKIIADVTEKIKNERSKQFIKNWEEEFRDGLKRKGKIEEKNEKYEEIDKKFETLEPSTSAAFAQELRNLKEEGKLDQGEEPTGEDVVDLENDDLSEVTSISEENQSSITTTNSNLRGEMAANKEEGDVIELGDSDSEHDEEEAFVEPMDTNEMVEVKLKTKEGKSNISTNEKSNQNNADDHFMMDLDNPTGPIIGNGESASSPPITPAKFNRLNEPTEKRIDDEEDDVICID